MKYREVLETIKKNSSSNNLFVTVRKTYPSSRGYCSKSKGCGLSEKKRIQENDNSLGQIEDSKQ